MSEQAEIFEALPQSLATNEAIQASISDEVHPHNDEPAEPNPPVIVHEENQSTTESIQGLIGRVQQLRQRSVNQNQLARCCAQLCVIVNEYLLRITTLVAVLMIPFTFYEAITTEKPCSEGFKVLVLLGLYGVLQCWRQFRSIDIDCPNSVIFICANIYYFSHQSCSTIAHLNLLFLMLSFAHLYLCILVTLAGCACCCCCCIIVLVAFLTGRRPNINGLLRNKEKALATIQSKANTDQLAECPICFEKEIDSELPCKHEFHRTCIENWFSNKTTCPVCRMEFG